MTDEIEGTAEVPVTDVTTPVAATEAEAATDSPQIDESAPPVAAEPTNDHYGAIRRLLAEAEADVEKGIEWFRAEIAKI